MAYSQGPRYHHNDDDGHNGYGASPFADSPYNNNNNNNNNTRFDDPRYEPYANQGHAQDQGYGDHTYQSQGYQNQGHQNQGFQDAGYQNPGYLNQGYSEPAHGGTGYDGGARYEETAYGSAPAGGAVMTDKTNAQTTYDDFGMGRAQANNTKVRDSNPWWNPRYWSRKIWIAVVAVVVIIIIVIIGVAVGVSQANKKNAYPDYSKINYKLSDTCKSSLTSRNLPLS